MFMQTQVNLTFNFTIIELVLILDRNIYKAIKKIKIYNKDRMG